MKKLMRVMAIFCAGVLGIAAQEIPPETVQLAHIRSHMTAQLKRQPNYTCLETVERSSRAAALKSFQLIDTLRLEVALVEGKEMFAWPGAKKFDSDDIRDLVKNGAIGNGNFASFAAAIFEGFGPVFTYRGVEDGRARYDYHVSLENSGYTIRSNNREAVVAYHGSIFADPATLDVRRIDVAAENIPPELNLAGTSTRMNYARMKIGASDFLLPEESELRMAEPGGREFRNHVRLTECREFTGESVLTFDEAPAESAPKARAPVQEVTLPAGVVLALKLTDEIDTATAAVGDPVHALLTRDARLKGTMVMAKGATVSGRIARLERSQNFTALGLEFDEAENASVHAHFKGDVDSVPQGWFLATTGNSSFNAIRRTPSGQSVILIRSGRVRIPRGTAFYWRTIDFTGER